MPREFRPAPEMGPRPYGHPARRTPAVGPRRDAAPVPPEAVFGAAASDLAPHAVLPRIAEAMPDILYVFDLPGRRNR